MKTSSAKAKGRKLQDMVRETLRFVFKGTLENDDIKSQVMGMSGEDIVLSPAAKKLIRYSFECKNQERLNLWSSIEQAESNKGKRQPVLVFKRNRSKTYAVIDFEHFIELINKNIGDK
tara:strand:+ start:27 stop:380 length:354 start_codon:yes stop_codon:yes gene_type:complete